MNLSFNRISSLKRRHFEKLTNLEVLYLSSNEIRKVDPKVFQHLEKLRKLDLKGNQIELPLSKGFLFHSKLEELNLDNCSIREIPHETFVNLTQLKNLTLSENPLDKDIDTSAFDFLKNLLKLRISTLSESTTRNLCNQLVSIDTINFGEFNLSCTVLSDDQTFEESIIYNAPVAEPNIDSIMSVPPPTSQKTTITPSTISHSDKFEVQLTNETATILPHTQLIITTDESSVNVTKPTTEIPTIDIDNETIKFILVGESYIVITNIKNLRYLTENSRSHSQENFWCFIQFFNFT